MKNKLRELRGNKRQKEIASAVGITTSYYGMIETGVRKPSLEVAIRIASYFGIPLDEIFFAHELNKKLDS